MNIEDGKILTSSDVHILQHTICFSNLDHSLVSRVTVPDPVLIQLSS